MPVPKEPTEQSEVLSLGRSRSISYAHGRGRRNGRALPKDNNIEETRESNDEEADVSIHAPLHSAVSVDSIATKASASKGDLFHQSILSADAIPGNIHMSSNTSIEHLIRRYGAVNLVRQISTDLAQREAELSLMRKRFSRRENALTKLLQEMGFTSSQIDSLVRERTDGNSDDDESFLQDLISDAMDDVLGDQKLKTSKESSTGITPVQSTTTTHKSSSASSLEEANTTITPKRHSTRPHSNSAPPDPHLAMSKTSDQSTYDTFLQSNSILNVVSNRFLNHVPQPVQDAISNTSHNTRLVPVEMENFNSNVFSDALQDDNNDGYIDQFGFMYDNRHKRTPRTSNSTTSVTDSSLFSKLQEIASGYDKNQQQTSKEWDEFIKRVTLMNTDTSRADDWLLINGKSIRHHKQLYKPFTRLVQGGIPMKYRAKVWSELSGSKHLMSPSEYHTLLSSVEPNTEAESQIQLDLYRTMPFNVFFKDNGPGLEKLQNVLIAFSRKYRGIGYCQGMNFIVANLLLVFQDEEEAFWAFIALIENILPSGFFNLSNIKHDLSVMKSNFKEQLPKLYNHFLECDVELEPICFNWFMSLFTDSLSVHIVFKVWDNLMLNGYIEIQKISIALFKIFEERLMSMNDNIEIYEFMKNLNRANFNLKGSELIRISSGIHLEDK